VTPEKWMGCIYLFANQTFKTVNVLLVLFEYAHWINIVPAALVTPKAKMLRTLAPRLFSALRSQTAAAPLVNGGSVWQAGNSGRSSSGNGASSTARGYSSVGGDVDIDQEVRARVRVRVRVDDGALFVFF
jgi:uncharacterized membrane protein YgcG